MQPCEEKQVLKCDKERQKTEIDEFCAKAGNDQITDSVKPKIEPRQDADTEGSRR